jgi:hypothetical protein
LRRLWRAPGGRYAAPAGGRLHHLQRLRQALTPDEYQAVRHLTAGLRRLPLDGDDLEHVLLSARDDDLELLIKCQGALRDATEAEGDGPAVSPSPGAAESAPPRRQPRLSFTFEADAPELRPYLASLRRNGFRAVSVESADSVTVFVEVHGTSDLEVVQAMALATSLRDLVGRATGHTLRGHRAGR